MRKIIQRRSEQAWRELVARQVKSGLSVLAFCRREGVSAWSLYGWRSRLRGPAREPERPAGAVAVTKEQPFIDLGALGSSGSRCEIRLELGGGVVLQVVRG